MGLGLWAVVVVLAFVALLTGYTWLFIKNSMLIAGSGYLARVNWRGQRKDYASSDVVAILRRSVAYGNQPAVPRLILLGQGNRQVMALDDRLWNDADLDAVWKSLGRVPDGSFDQVVTASQLRRDYPGLVPWWQAHPRLTGFLLTPVILVVVIGFLAVTGHLGTAGSSTGH